jgi:GalNAc-alpha-(1->4)-GalNAc-alpha-(1->3)-diNAcBac-PP-undecaprenol alpha-1,4-N-acetyl-D-galactosaminyltransferase
MVLKKTIAFAIYSLNAGGAERVLTALANELRSTFNVYIITIIPCNSFYKLHPEVKLLNCNFKDDENQRFIHSINNNFKKIKVISAFIKQETIDIIISFTTSVNVLAIIASKSSGIPCIVSERNNPQVNPPNKFWAFLRNRTYNYANCLVVQTNENKSFFSKVTKPNKIKVIKNPISTDLAMKKQGLKTAAKKKIILTVGRLDENKAQSLLINAFSDIKNKDDWKVEILGDGSMKNELQQLVKKKGMESKISFLGVISDVENFYASSSIFVFTSRSEGYPNVLAEAQFFGLPCISTNCPNGPADLIENNYNGILIDVDNQDLLKIQLERLMFNEDLRTYLGKNAQLSSESLLMHNISNMWISLIKSYL